MGDIRVNQLILLHLFNVVCTFKMRPSYLVFKSVKLGDFDYESIIERQKMRTTKVGVLTFFRRTGIFTKTPP